MQNGAISVKHRNSVLVLLAASGGKTIKLKCCLAELQNGTIILINMTLCLDTDQRQLIYTLCCLDLAIYITSSLT